MMGAFFFLFGLVIGSFLNVCIYRIPKHISIVKPASFCPRCKKKIKFYDNIPIISYILLKGKCRYCGVPISLQYPLVELFTGIMSLGLFMRYGFGYEYIINFIFVCSLIVVSVIDIHHQIIPDIITISGILMAFIIPVFEDRGFADVLIGILVGGGSLFLIAVSYFFITGKEGMGGGDIKLLGMIGGWLGVKALLPVIMFASISGLIVGIIWIIKSGGRRDLPIPFGPFLSLGAIFYLFFHHLLPYPFNLMS